MVVQRRRGRRAPGRRRTWPRDATAAPLPPGGAVVASLRGVPTALRARVDGPSPSRRCRWPRFMVASRRCRSDSSAVRTPHARVAGRAELPPLADEHLVERARSDPDAFAELYRRHVTRVHAFVYRRTRSRELADEITSATFERALRGLPTFRWREGGFQAWLYRIAANELVSHYRRAQRIHSERGQRAARHLHDTGEAGDHPLEDEDSELVLQALGGLNERYQRAITLRYLAGMSADEAAQAMGLNKTTLAVVLHRALGALRTSMHRLEREARGGSGAAARKAPR